MRAGALIFMAAIAAVMAPNWAQAEEIADQAEVDANEQGFDWLWTGTVKVAQAERRGAWVSRPAPREPSAEPVRARSSGGSLLDDLFGTSSSIPREFRRQTVRYESKHKAGTIVIDTSKKYLYHVKGDGTATRYGVGVGRQGFEWKGQAYVGNKREWPGWTPPASMRAREPWLPAHMPGGPDNPLGARAMYLYKGGADTLYRIHGTNQPTSIGQALSSGCIRMLNADVEHLYDNVDRGTKVVVL